MKMYLTKYALTDGIKVVDAESTSSDNDYVKVSGYYSLFTLKKDITPDKKVALQRAEEMRITKLKSLDKQIKKLSALKFTIEE